MIVLYILLAIVILLFMILVHELGHYIAGKILKFKITEFSIGFGFPIFSKTNKKTGEKFSLRIFPLGGYCAFDGEDDDGENKSPTAFNNQKPWKRIIVLLGGVTMNFITAILFSWILLSCIGYDVPQIQTFNSTTYSYVQTVEEGEEGEEGESNGFSFVNPYQKGDVITHINGKKIDFAFGGNYVTLVNNQRANAKKKYDTVLKVLNEQYLEQHPELDAVSVEQQNKMLAEYIQAELEKGEDSALYTFEMTVRHKSLHGKKETLNITVCPIVEEYTEKNKEGVEEVKQRLNVYVGLESAEGAKPCTKAYVYNAWEGFCRSFEMAFGFAWVVLKSLWMLITFQIPITQMTGTIGTITTIATMASQSLSYLLIFIPLIAANLAIFNLLPIPSLDGAHILFTIIEWIRGKPINRKVENMIHFVGLCILLGFVVIIDILHFVL